MKGVYMSDQHTPRRSVETASMEAYSLAQQAMQLLRIAIYKSLEASPDEGLRNSELGRVLGVYMGHAGHQGHVTRTVLALMENEGAVVQDPENRKWRLAIRMENCGT